MDMRRRMAYVKSLKTARGSIVDVPEIVQKCADRLPSEFFSVDVARRADGALRVVEVGDGQVSDLVGWSPEAFVAMWVRSGKG